MTDKYAKVQSYMQVDFTYSTMHRGKFMVSSAAK